MKALSVEEWIPLDTLATFVMGVVDLLEGEKKPNPDRWTLRLTGDPDGTRVIAPGGVDVTTNLRSVRIEQVKMDPPTMTLEILRPIVEHRIGEGEEELKILGELVEFDGPPKEGTPGSAEIPNSPEHDNALTRELDR